MSPRSAPSLFYKYFCDLTRRKPGELFLSLQTESQFRGLVGHFFVVPLRDDFFEKLRAKGITRAWQKQIDKQIKRKRIYVRRNEPSITDNLWVVLHRRYWNYAAWIILRGEYKAMKKTLPDNEIQKQLKEHYSYLPQVKCAGWFEEVKGGGNSPLDLADRDTAAALGLDEDTLRVALSPGQLRASPPGSLVLIAAFIDSKKLLPKLRRSRTPKDRLLIRAIEAEFHPPKTR